jgi:hypothetical protein
VRNENGPANFKKFCAINFCVKLGESATFAYEKLQRAYGEHSLSRAQVLFQNFIGYVAVFRAALL